MASSTQPDDQKDEAEDKYQALSRRVGRLETRVRETERIIIFAATRAAAVLLLVALLVPAVSMSKPSGGSSKVTTERLLTLPFAIINDVGADDSDAPVAYAFAVGFAGLAFVALWCCLRLAFIDTVHDEIGKPTVIAAWLLAVGTGIALLIMLVFSGMSDDPSDEWTIGPGPWLLGLAAAFACGLLIPEGVRRWVGGDR